MRSNFKVVVRYRFNTELSVLQETQAFDDTDDCTIASRGTFGTFRRRKTNQIHEAFMLHVHAFGAGPQSRFSSSVSTN